MNTKTERPTKLFVGNAEYDGDRCNLTIDIDELLKYANIARKNTTTGHRHIDITLIPRKSTNKFSKTHSAIIRDKYPDKDEVR